MDDGQRVSRGGVTLCTDSYKPEEISLLRKVLRENFNLITSIHKKKNPNDINSPYERIYINKESLDTIKDSLKQHMHSSMLYKLNITENNIEPESKIDENNKPADNIDYSDNSSDID